MTYPADPTEVRGSPPSQTGTPASKTPASSESWLHEYGFIGERDFSEAEAAVEALGFTWVYGGADANPEWPGWPAAADALFSALKEARERLVEAYEYGCEWPIGLSDDPQEQRGMSRDSFIRNMEFGRERIDAALEASVFTTSEHVSAEAT